MCFYTALASCFSFTKGDKLWRVRWVFFSGGIVGHLQGKLQLLMQLYYFGNHAIWWNKQNLWMCFQLKQQTCWLENDYLNLVVSVKSMYNRVEFYTVYVFTLRNGLKRIYFKCLWKLRQLLCTFKTQKRHPSNFRSLGYSGTNMYVVNNMYIVYIMYRIYNLDYMYCRWPFVCWTSMNDHKRALLWVFMWRRKFTSPFHKEVCFESGTL